MSRRKADPVDIAFRAWAQLDDKQRDGFERKVEGYWEAIRKFSLDGVTPKAPAPRVRQRKANGKLGPMPGFGEGPLPASRPLPKESV